MRSLLHALAGALLLLAVRTAAAPIRLSGSDLAGRSVQQALASYASRENVEIVVDLVGSLQAREALRQDGADAALLLVDPRQPAVDPAARFSGADDLHRVAVASLVAYVLVASDNPVEQVDFDQLSALFGSRSELRRWGELGGTGVWQNRSIAPAVWSRRSSPVQGLFAHLVLQGTPARAGMLEPEDRAGLLGSFSDQPGLIALVPFPPAPKSGAKALRIARTAGFPADEPSPEAIARGAYPLRLPVELVYPRDKAETVAPLLRFFATAEAAAALDEAMLTPLPPDARAQLASKAGR